MAVISRESGPFLPIPGSYEAATLYTFLHEPHTRSLHTCASPSGRNPHHFPAYQIIRLLPGPGQLLYPGEDLWDFPWAPFSFLCLHLA